MPPLLRFGSQGPDVKLLQTALNGAPSMHPPLVADAMFGGKTHGKVIEYQRNVAETPDGIVGPKTWAALQPHIDALAKLIPRPAGGEEALGKRIVQVAENCWGAFGWPSGVVTPSPGSQRIAAGVREDPTADPSPRQGWQTLQHIFMVGGGKPSYTSRIPTLSEKTERSWRMGDSVGINDDIGSWCGVFAFYIYRCAGIFTPGGFDSSHASVRLKHFDITVNPKSVKPGSIGVIDGGVKNWGNHHFIVVHNDVERGVIYSIDGNAGAPFGSTQGLGFSVIARREYSHSIIPRNNNTYFMFPKAAP